MCVNTLRAACSKTIALNSFKISLVVGSLLNLINQAGAVLDQAGINWFEFFLNYLIPYCVASYSAAKNHITNENSV